MTEQAAMEKELRVLILEDTPTDAELMERELRKAGLAFTSRRVETQEAFVRAIDDFKPDIVLSDYKLPEFDGMAALKIVQRDHPEMPVIMVTGALPDIEAVELIHAGAKDYVLKDRLARLGPAVQRVLSVERGVRARKVAEQALRDSEEKFRSIYEGSDDAIMLLTENGFFDCNGGTLKMLGLTSKDELIGQHPYQFSPPLQPDGRDSLTVENEKIATAFMQGVNRFDWVHRRKNGEDFPVEVLLSAFDLYGRKVLQATVRDITERKKAEAELIRLNRVLKTLNECDHTLLHAANEAELMHSMCRVITASDGYSLAWIGLARQDENKSIEPVAISGAGKAYVEALHLTWDDIPKGRGPSGIAIRTGQTQIVQNVKTDPRFELWREAAAEYGYASNIAMPLKDKGQVFGMLNIYSLEASAFSQNEVTLLEDVANDLAFGIMSLRAQTERDLAVKERQHYAERLRTSLEESLQAISATVEMRDPYTAGHQRRVAQLASAMAREMGLPEEQIHGIYLAGVVHDLGKIRVPAEILSKPGQLNDIEFSLIKIHPQAGYDILKGIEFPWPIAQAVLQHHERIDGSGYPQGLKAENILLEARILTVADVVEAMSSHRPYRAGLGLDAALEEIVKQRGVLYDPAAVDACIAMFREKGFVFE